MAISSLLLVSTAAAQSPSAEQLQKQLDDANAQLKSAQDRKNELALENQKLQKEIEELKAREQQVRERLDSLENSSYYMGEHYAAWQIFVEANPPIRAMWIAYFNGQGEGARRIAELLNTNHWPFGIEPSQTGLGLTD